MTGFEFPAPEISQLQMEDLLGFVEQVRTSPFAHERGGDLPGFHVSASTQEAASAVHTGYLTVEDNPQLDPTAFLSVRYTEIGYQFETSRFFVFYKDSEEKFTLRVSAPVDDMETNRTMWAAGEEADELAKERVAEAFDWEELQVRGSLKDATKKDYDTLDELLTFGLMGDKHDLRSEEEKAADDEYYRSLQIEHQPRRPRAAQVIRKLLGL